MASWLLLAVLLAAALPLFICMPPWVDVTYHDLSARNVLNGGVHYRDVFETNLPGMVWHHALVRSLFGWSFEAMKAADLAVVGSAVFLLAAWLRRAGVPPLGRLWFVIAAAFFYLGGTEFIHCQRDGWMLLPTVIALHLRGNQLRRVDSPQATRRRLFAASTWEGLFWGWAVWIKPHAIVPAVALWLASSGRVTGGAQRRAGLVDLAGLITGGLVAGAAGSVWLYVTGAWPHLWDVLLNWNREYYDWSAQAMTDRVKLLFTHFAPWSLIHAVSLPAAVYSLFAARVWRARDGCPAETTATVRALLAALYLGWLAEATLLQKPFPYAHAPVVMLGLAVLTSFRWPAGPLFLTWCVAGSLVYLLAASSGRIRSALAWFEEAKPITFKQVVPQHPLLDTRRLAYWPRCVWEGPNDDLRDELTFYPGIFCVTDWTQLSAVEAYLRDRGVGDRELICWYDSTHPLYLRLGVTPGIRFMHVMTVLDFPSRLEDVRQEVIASRHRYVVSDLAMLARYWEFNLDPPPGQPNHLPADFPKRRAASIRGTIRSFSAPSGTACMKSAIRSARSCFRGRRNHAEAPRSAAICSRTLLTWQKRTWPTIMDRGAVRVGRRWRRESGTKWHSLAPQEKVFDVAGPTTDPDRPTRDENDRQAQRVAEPEFGNKTRKNVNPSGCREMSRFGKDAARGGESSSGHKVHSDLNLQICPIDDG